MPTGLGASVWADGHGGRTAANKERMRLRKQIPIEPDFDTTTQAKDKNGSDNYSPISQNPLPDPLKLQSNLLDDQGYKKPSPEMKAEPEMTLPSAALDSPEELLESIQETGSTDGTDTESMIELGPVEEYIETLDLPKFGPEDFRMLELPYEERVYSVKLLCSMRNTRMHPKPFINIPPGPFFEIRKGFKIANIAKAKGLSLAEAVEKERLGEIVVPDSPEWVKQGRRWRSPSHSSQYSKSDREILESIAPLEIGCTSDTSSLSAVMVDDENLENHISLLPAETSQHNSSNHSPRLPGRLTPYSEYVESLNLLRINEQNLIKEDSFKGHIESENSFHEVFESEDFQPQEIELGDIEPDGGDLAGMKPENDVSEETKLRDVLLKRSDTTYKQLRGFKSDSFSSLAEIDRQQLKQLLQTHIASEIESPRTLAVTAVADALGPLMDSNGQGKEVSIPPAKEPLNEDLQTVVKASVNDTLTLIENLRKSADGAYSLKDSLSLIEMSLLGQSQNVQVDGCGKSRDDKRQLNLQNHPQPLDPIDDSVKAANVASSRVDESLHQSQISRAISETDSEISVEIIVDYQPIKTEPSSRVVINTKQTSHEPVISSGPSDFQIEPNAQYDDVLPETQQLQCHLCSFEKQYKSMNKLIDHWERKHYYCDKCHLVYAHRGELINHLVNEKSEHNFCEECMADFQSPDALISHCQKFHSPPDNSIDCPGCRACCTSAVEVIQHIETGSCPNISKQQFGRARVVTALVQRHALGPVQDCSPDEKFHIEDQSFKLLRGDNCIVNGLPLVKESAWSPNFDVEMHRVLNHGQQMYRCPYAGCSKHFRADLDFIDHLQAGHFYHGICPGCFKEFKVASALLRHLMKGHRVCKLARGPVFAHAIAAVSGSYIKAEPIDLFGNWKFVAGVAPPVELYMELPQVMGSSNPSHDECEW